MTKKINVLFVYEENKPLFRIHGDSGAIRKTNVSGGKLVFLQREHKHKFETGQTYAGFFNITNREGKSTELLIPIEGELITKVDSGQDTNVFKKPDQKRVGKSYFEDYGISMSSPENILNMFLWAAQKGNLKLIKELANLGWELNKKEESPRFRVHTDSNISFAIKLAKENNNKTVLAFLETI